MRGTVLGLIFKLSQEVVKTWGRLRAPEKVTELLDWAPYVVSP